MVDSGAEQHQRMNNKGFSFTDRVILVPTYLISRYFFMIAQTRQFPTIFTTTSMECTVAMAMPDDSNMSMVTIVDDYTVWRPPTAVG